MNAAVIHNIVDVSNFQYVKREKRDKYAFVSVGNLIQIKGFDLLIEAFAEAFKDDKSVSLKIVGDGPERYNLQNIANQCNVNDKITFLGEICREKLRDVYKESDAFVLTSRSETFGVAYIEAMTTGIPVIATACGGPNDFVNEQNGYLIPVDDKNALIDALKKMRDNAYSFNSLEISEMCANKFSPENIANLLVSLYKEIIH